MKVSLGSLSYFFLTVLLQESLKTFFIFIPMSLKTELSKKIKNKSARIGIIGMGYVGAALADLIIEKGFATTGFVLHQETADAINNKRKKFLSATADISQLKNCDVIFVCVQTPVDENKLPDLSFLTTASQQVADHLHKGQLIIIESSIATGTTRNIVLPILKQTELKEGRDFFLAFSPERVDPGNKKFDLGDIPKVVSGLEENSLKLTTLFYKQIMKKVVPVSTLETAELVKLFENTFRLVNISLVNELTPYAKSWNVDMWEVVNAASTKPFGFLPHYPSPGIGGHCIPVDPFYMLDDARKRGMNLSLIEQAGKINDDQPYRVVDRALEILKTKTARHEATSASSSSYSPAYQFLPVMDQSAHAVPLSGEKGGESSTIHKAKPFKVLLLGVAYKPDIDDQRESPALRIWDILEDEGCDISYHDPYISRFKGTSSIPFTDEELKQFDMFIIVTNHSAVDYEKLAKYEKPILDTRNVYATRKQNRFPHIYSL